MNIIFRVDSSLIIGLGHLMRCLTLAQALKEKGSDVKFICRKHEGSLIEKVRSSGFIAYELEAFKETQVDTKLVHSNWLGVTQQKDADDCIEILKLDKVDWLIVDHYALDELWQKKLKPYYEKLMVIDDLADRKHQCDILLDQTFGCQQEDYLESEDRIKEQSRLQGFQDAINYLWKMDLGFDEHLETLRVAKSLENALINEEIDLMEAKPSSSFVSQS